MKFTEEKNYDSEWPFDCIFDLPGIMEDVPEIIKKVNQDDYNFKLDFYEQGVEQEIIFEDNGNDVNLTCVSRTNWRPNPRVIVMNKQDINRQFTSLYKNFGLYFTDLS